MLQEVRGGILLYHLLEFWMLDYGFSDVGAWICKPSTPTQQNLYHHPCGGQKFKPMRWQSWLPPVGPGCSLPPFPAFGGGGGGAGMPWLGLRFQSMVSCSFDLDLR